LQRIRLALDYTEAGASMFKQFAAFNAMRKSVAAVEGSI
jgi:hypothetical protein